MAEKTRDAERIMDITGLDLNDAQAEEVESIATTLGSQIRSLESTAERISELPKREKKERAIELLEDIQVKVDEASYTIARFNANVAMIPKIAADTRKTKLLIMMLLLLIAIGFTVVLSVVR